MTPSERPVTHPAKLPAALQRNLSLYALAATAAGVQVLALAQPSEAEVIYTPAHTFIGSNRHFSFDLNNDGVNDFTILNLYARNSSYTGCRLEVRPDGGGMTDAELLVRFSSSRDNNALAALVRRHAPMVWSVCCRLLSNRHDGYFEPEVTDFRAVDKFDARLFEQP